MGANAILATWVPLLVSPIDTIVHQLSAFGWMRRLNQSGMLKILTHRAMLGKVSGVGSCHCERASTCQNEEKWGGMGGNGGKWGEMGEIGNDVEYI